MEELSTEGLAVRTWYAGKGRVVIDAHRDGSLRISELGDGVCLSEDELFVLSEAIDFIKRSYVNWKRQEDLPQSK